MIDIDTSVIYGYARVSTSGQKRDGNGLQAQISALHAAGATVVRSDITTGINNDRSALQELLRELKTGDTLVVTKIDRLGRSVCKVMEIVEDLLKRHIKINILNMGIVDDSPIGKFLLQIMVAFAEFERDLIIQRTQEGKTIARMNPDYREGRPRKFNQFQLDHAMQLLAEHSYKQVERMTGISVATLVREKRRRQQL